MVDDGLLDRDAITSLLEEVATELESRGLTARMFVVVGAAMALVFGRERVTRDVDAVFEPKQVIDDVARTVGDRHGLAPDWLNDGVKRFLHGADPDARVVLDRPGLTVEVASPRYLFTLKALAARVDRDARDLEILYRVCGFADVDDALAHVAASVPPALLQPKTEFLVRELLDDA